MPEMNPEEVGKEMARQAIQYVIKTLKERVMTVWGPISPVTVFVKYDPSEDNPVTLTPLMTPHKAEDYDECPLCAGDWHGLTGDGVIGAAGCPGECGSDEEKQRWVESGSPTDEVPASDDVLAYCIGLLDMAEDLLDPDSE